jgi:DNA-binding MarR family transcriptional regulator
VTRNDSHSSARGPTAPAPRPAPVGLGAALRRAWLGYQRRLDGEMAAAGFADRALPDGRVLRLCAAQPMTTISQIGRHLGVSRQAASKIVSRLSQNGYATVAASATSGREKVVALTPRGKDYLVAQRRAARSIERSLARELGPEAVAGIGRLLEALGGEGDVRLLDYLRGQKSSSEGRPGR